MSLCSCHYPSRDHGKVVSFRVKTDGYVFEGINYKDAINAWLNSGKPSGELFAVYEDGYEDFWEDT